MTNAIRIVALVIVVAVTAVVGYRLLTGAVGVHYYQVVGIGKEAKKVPINSIELGERKVAIMEDAGLTAEQKAARLQALDETVYFSWSRTMGLWIGALLTLAVFSFLYKDNPLYRAAEHAFVGISAAYAMVLTFWSVVVPNLVGELFPRFNKYYISPEDDLNQVVHELALRSWLADLVPYEAALGRGLAAAWYQLMDFWYWIPAVLGLMLVWRLLPRGGWISRWPLAFIIGATAGMRMVGYIGADVIDQIKAAMVPLIEYQYISNGPGGQPVFSFGQTFYASMNNLLLLFGTLCVLTYFFFSLEHRGLVGRVSRIGIWVLMVTFGAGFGYTVMGRIALLVGRFEFLVQEWLYYVPT